MRAVIKELENNLFKEKFIEVILNTEFLRSYYENLFTCSIDLESILRDAISRAYILSKGLEIYGCDGLTTYDYLHKRVWVW